uniref:hypothetical protein n=1 Tax=Photorhabdus sp. RM322S TaxID=3342825 RepID=UPI0036DDEA0A
MGIIAFAKNQPKSDTTGPLPPGSPPDDSSLPARSSRRGRGGDHSATPGLFLSSYEDWVILGQEVA